MKRIIFIVMFTIMCMSALAIQEKKTHSDFKVGEDAHWSLTITADNDSEDLKLDLPNYAYKIKYIENNVEKDILSKKNKISKSDIITIEYDTPAPRIEETKLNNGKYIKVYDNNEVGYTNILASTMIDRDARKVIVKDESGNVMKSYMVGNKIYWYVPHLSEQYYSIIYVSMAELYSSDLTYLLDVTGAISRIDNVYTNVEPDQYVKLTFQYPLDNSKDISIYAKSEGTASLEIYDDNMTLLGDILNVRTEKNYRFLLKDLEHNTDTFYIRAKDATVMIDYIVDPTYLYCFQETANVSSTCYGKSLLNTGLYYTADVWSAANNVSRAYDGDWSTQAVCNSGSCNLYINYTKPVGASNDSIWAVTSNCQNLGFGNNTNLTIPSACYNYNANTLMLRATSTAATSSVWSCYNGTWSTLYTCAVNGDVIEEGMWWAFPYQSPNVSNIQITQVPIPNQRIDCTYTAFNDTIGNAVNVSITWYQNKSGVVARNTTYDYNKTSVSNNTVYTTGAGTGSYGGVSALGDSFRCQLTINDGLNTYSANSSWTTVVNTMYNFSFYGFNAWNKSKLINLSVNITVPTNNYVINSLSSTVNPNNNYNFLQVLSSKDIAGANNGIDSAVVYNTSGANFNTAAYINTTIPSTFINNDFTICAFFNASTQSDAANTLVSSYQAGVAGVALYAQSPGSIVALFNNGTFSSQAGDAFVPGRNMGICAGMNSSNTWSVENSGVYKTGVRLTNMGSIGTSKYLYIGKAGELGAGFGMNGSMTQVLFFNRSLSRDEVALVFQYKNTDWNATGNLTTDYDCRFSNITYTAQGYMNNYSYVITNCNATSNSSNQSFWQTTATVNLKSQSTGLVYPAGQIIINDTTLSNTTALPSTTFYLNSGTYSINGSSTYATTSNATTQTFAYGTNNVVDLTLPSKLIGYLYREFDGTPFNISENATVNYSIMMSVYCANVSLNSNVTSNVFTLTDINCIYNRYAIRVTTSAGSSYIRYGIPDTINNMSIYLIDPKVDTAVQYIYQLNDLNNQWRGGYVNVYTFINGTRVKVIQESWAIDGTVVLWLTKYSQYDFCMVDIYGNEDCIGTITAETAQTVTVVQPGIPMSYNNTFAREYYKIAGDKDSGTAQMNLTDLSGLGFSYVNWTIFQDNITSGIVPYTSYNANVFNLSLTATGLNRSENYIYVLDIFSNDTSYGHQTHVQPLWLADHITFTGFEEWDADIKLWIGIIIPLLIIFVASVTSILILFPIAIVFMGIFNNIGWYIPIATVWQINIIVGFFGALIALMYWHQQGAK